MTFPSQKRRKTARPAHEREIALKLILIDQAPLRRSVAAEWTHAMAELEDVRRAWHRFEREDCPAFVRWRAREFGALLSESRDVEVRIREARALVHEVEMEMRRFFQTPQSAYRRVMFRRENPGTMEDEPHVSEPDLPGATRKLSEFEQEALFQEWVQKFLGTNPDKMDDAAYAKTFETFKSHMFRMPQEEREARNGQRVASKARMEIDQEHEQEREVVTEADARVKELYRRLVRRLHPDLRADGSADVAAVWHEVQEAYAAGDIPRMEILLALSNIQANKLGEETSVSQMRSVLNELRRSLGALEKSLMEAEGEEAWNFARNGPSDDLRIRVERQLKFDLAGRARHLDLLERTIAGWKTGDCR